MIEAQPTLSQHWGRHFLLAVEAAVLLLLIVAFWHLPPVRSTWLHLFWLALPLFWLRGLVYGRVVPASPLNLWLIAFILLSVYNYNEAPLQRARYLDVMARPLLGMWLVVHFVTHGGLARRITPLLLATLGMAATVGVLALTATQWPFNKAPLIAPVMGWMPEVAYGVWFPDMLLRFNPNEIAGALAWVTPLPFALMLHGPTRTGAQRALRLAAGVVFAVLAVALFLGQSRAAIGGVLPLLFVLTPVIVRNWRGRAAVWGALVLVGALQVYLILAISSFGLGGTGDLSDPDVNSVQQSAIFRAVIWESAGRMLSDQPLTGVGMSMFRTAFASAPYSTPVYADRIMPHAHNEYLQIGADLGVGGLVLSAWLAGIVLFMLWRVWRHGSATARVLALGVCGGLAAHAIYGLADTIALWDRYAFVFWWLLGLLGAIHAKTEAERHAA